MRRAIFKQPPHTDNGNYTILRKGCQELFSDADRSDKTVQKATPLSRACIEEKITSNANFWKKISLILKEHLYFYS